MVSLLTRHSERLKQSCTIRSTQSCARVPAWPCGISSIVATGHISQGVTLHKLWVVLIENGIQIPNGLPSFLVHERDQACPERRNGTGSTERRALSIDVDLIACCRIGITCNIRHPASDTLVRIFRWWYVCIGLPCRQVEEIAYATTCCSLIISLLIPDNFTGDLVVRRF